jgi:hypothetical protein
VKLYFTFQNHYTTQKPIRMGKDSKKNRRERLKKNGTNGDQVKKVNEDKDVVESTKVAATATLGSSLTAVPASNNRSRNDGERTNDRTTLNDDKEGDHNPLHVQQQEFLSKLTYDERHHFFSNTHIDPIRRAELWMEQADLGEGLVNRYAWATPTTSTCLRIFQEFSPLIEIGCGSNAYWANWMVKTSKDMSSHGDIKKIDIVTFDFDIEEGGRIGDAKNNDLDVTRKSEGKKRERYINGGIKDSCSVRQGGPEVLSHPDIVQSNRTLFLCYPDEYDDDNSVQSDGDIDESEHDDDGEDDDDDDSDGEFYEVMNDDDDAQEGELKRSVPSSFGWQCLDHYQGTYVIHVGELMLDANLSMDQAPWGRSSSPEFQQRLASEFHCILKVQLPSNWLHVRDSISVWKRTELCPIVFAVEGNDDNDGEDDEDEEVVEYRYIPPQEMLPSDLAAPCMAHLLPTASSLSPKTPTSKSLSTGIPSNDGNNQNPASKSKRKLESSPTTSSEESIAVVNSTNVNDSKSTTGQSKSHKKRKKSPNPEKKARRNINGNSDDTASTSIYNTPW